MLRTASVVAVVALLGLSSTAAAAPLTITTWDRITNNASANVGSQLWAEMTDLGAGHVEFQFKNSVGTPSSVTQIYFDDTTPLSFLGAFTLVFGWFLGRHDAVPLKDPELMECLEYHS